MGFSRITVFKSNSLKYQIDPPLQESRVHCTGFVMDPAVAAATPRVTTNGPVHRFTDPPDWEQLTANLQSDLGCAFCLLLDEDDIYVRALQLCTCALHLDCTSIAPKPKLCQWAFLLVSEKGGMAVTSRRWAPSSPGPRCASGHPAGRYGCRSRAILSPLKMFSLGNPTCNHGRRRRNFRTKVHLAPSI